MALLIFTTTFLNGRDDYFIFDSTILYQKHLYPLKPEPGCSKLGLRVHRVIVKSDFRSGSYKIESTTIYFISEFDD